MSAATLPAPLFVATPDEPVTLDERVVAVLEDLALRDRARCLVCGGEVVATARPCSHCGASLT
jgi:hypothetical protein